MRERMSMVAVIGMAAALLAGSASADEKHSRAHDVAVQRCVAAYEAGAKAAHAPGSPTGAIRKRTMHRLAEEKKACIARAPR